MNTRYVHYFSQSLRDSRSFLKGSITYCHRFKHNIFIWRRSLQYVQINAFFSQWQKNIIYLAMKGKEALCANLAPGERWKWWRWRANMTFKIPMKATYANFFYFHFKDRVSKRFLLRLLNLHRVDQSLQPLKCLLPRGDDLIGWQ